ncbi:NineTeen Complex (NTC) component [Microbotryomycetes sp. JL221]|nr:NineTeen Complex (NTC) component [Microbotryomycetes sp. JL221]
MARNEEKAQSMLYRFRESQAAELGLSIRSDRRPRLASQCKDLRQAERWRGEILREISRKVSKIQDAGLTDYEVRDLNDEINKLLREKRHWENQIVFLGGANYKRASGSMTDAAGREIPGMRGYKYFGRAKDLPGVKELFANAAAETEEAEKYKHKRHTIFSDPGPNYWGEQDDEDEGLLKAERDMEEEAWEDALDNLRETVELPDPAPAAPEAHFVSLNQSGEAQDEEADDQDAQLDETATTTGKRKAASKKKTTSAAAASKKKTKTDAGAVDKAQRGPGFMSVLLASDLRPPNLLTADEMDKVIVAAQKKLLLQEYALQE